MHDDFQSVLNQKVFDQKVKRRLSRKTWALVDFQKIHFFLIIEHKIKTQNLITKTLVLISGLSLSVLRVQMRLHWNDGFDDTLLDLAPDSIGITTQSTEGLEKLSQRLFVTKIEITHGLVELIFGTVFIYCVISQVKAQIINVIFRWFLVFFSSESDQTLFI